MNSKPAIEYCCCTRSIQLAAVEFHLMGTYLPVAANSNSATIKSRPSKPPKANSVAVVCTVLVACGTLLVMCDSRTEEAELFDIR